MGDLIAFPIASLRPKEELFYETVETVLKAAFDKLKKECGGGQEIRVVGLISSPAPPDDESVAEYGVEICTCDEDDAAIEDAANIIAGIAVRTSESLGEIMETIQRITGRAREMAKSLYISE